MKTFKVSVLRKEYGHFYIEAKDRAALDAKLQDGDYDAEFVPEPNEVEFETCYCDLDELDVVEVEQ